MPRVAPTKTVGEGDEEDELTTASHTHERSTLHLKCVSIFRSKNVYYLLLNLGWWPLGQLGLCVYVTTCLIHSAFMEALGGSAHLEFSGDLDEQLSGFGKTFLFATTNLVTMGWGPYSTTEAWCYVLGTIQQLSGVILNVFIFSIVITKFQQPQPDLVFSKNVLFTQRDGKGVMLVRVGNLRCNLVYQPEFRVSVLKRCETAEGESFMQSHAVDATEIVAMTAAHTMAIPVEGTALEGINKKHLETLEHGSLSIFVSIGGRDSVYFDDLYAVKKYSPDDFMFDCLFANTFEVDEQTGALVCNFKNFHKLMPFVPQWPKDQQTLPDSVLEQICSQFEEPLSCKHLSTVGDVLDKSPVIGTAPPVHEHDVVLFSGSVMFRGILWRACIFCNAVEMLAVEANLPITVIRANLLDKPKYYTDKLGEGATFPALCVNGTEWIMGTADVLARLGELFPEFKEAAARRPKLPEHIQNEPGGLYGFATTIAMLQAAEGRARGDPDATEVFNQGEEKIAQVLDAYEDRLSKAEWLGDDISYADALMTSIILNVLQLFSLKEFASAKVGLQQALAYRPGICAWLDRVRNRPSYRAVCAPPYAVLLGLTRKFDKLMSIPIPHPFSSLADTETKCWNVLIGGSSPLPQAPTTQLIRRKSFTHANACL